MVPVAIAVTRGDACSTAHSASVDKEASLVLRVIEVAGIGVGAVVRTVTNAIGIHIRARSTAHTAQVVHIAVAITVANRDASPSTNPAFIGGLAGTVGLVAEVAGCDVCTVVNVVTDAVRVCV